MPGWLCAMIIKLYKQMTEIRVHIEELLEDTAARIGL
jgi:hypothetical protein